MLEKMWRQHQIPDPENALSYSTTLRQPPMPHPSFLCFSYPPFHATSTFLIYPCRTLDGNGSCTPGNGSRVKNRVPVVSNKQLYNSSKARAAYSTVNFLSSTAEEQKLSPSNHRLSRPNNNASQKNLAKCVTTPLFNSLHTTLIGQLSFNSVKLLTTLSLYSY